MNLEATLTLEQTLWYLSPELVLLLTGVLVLGLDALRPRQEEKRWLPYVVLVGLVGALVATATLWGLDDTRVLYVLSVDSFALAVKAIALVVMGIVILVSDVYIRAHSRFQGEFYALLAFSALAICLLGAATDLIMIFVTFDFLSIVSYVLTGYLRDDPRSTEAAVKYFLYGAALSAVMLFGLSWFYGLTGSTDLAGIATAFRATEAAVRPLFLMPLIMVLAGFAFKVGVVPFHQWAPDAYEGAPTPVTAFLSVGPKVAGFALITRVMLTALPADISVLALDWQTLVSVLAVITMTMGNLVALWQQNIKRLFAYSSIAQAGYILIGVVAISPAGVTAVLLYLLAYALTNLGAFAAIVAFSNVTGSDDIDDYAGLSKRAPSLAVVLLICLLSLGGIPPMAGFFAKFYLFAAALQSGYVWLAVVGVVNSVISLGYYWKVIRAMYLIPAETEERVASTPALTVAMWIAVIGVFAVVIFANPLLILLQTAAQTFFAG